MITAIWHWHSFVEIALPSWSILIDPYISWNKLCDVDIETISKKNIIKIVLSHWHLDHIADASLIAEKTWSEIVACTELSKYMEEMCWVKNVYPMNIWWEYKFDEGEIKFVNAVHSSWIGKAGSWWAGNSAWILIKAEWKSIYHAWDTALHYDMKLLWEYENIDLSLLPIWWTYTMWIKDAVIASWFIKSKIVVPIHYNTFEDIMLDPIDFARLIMSESMWTIPKVLDIWQYVLLN